MRSVDFCQTTWVGYHGFMSRNPFVNAVAAAGYILFIGILFSLVRFLPEPTNPLQPAIGILTLFVFSAALMGYLIIGMPLRLYIEGEKKEAITLFGKTLAAFVLCGVILFIITLFIPAIS